MIERKNPLMKLIEECAELQMALCKADRFGWFNYHPDRPESTNFEDVMREMNDVVEAIERMQELMRQIQITHLDGQAPTDALVPIAAVGHGSRGADAQAIDRD